VWTDKDASGSEDPAVGGGLHGDSETRAFYEDLPDLLTLVPLTILGFTPEQVRFSPTSEIFILFSFHFHYH
jgi:hypothetical protein